MELWRVASPSLRARAFALPPNSISLSPRGSRARRAGPVSCRAVQAGFTSDHSAHIDHCAAGNVDKGGDPDSVLSGTLAASTSEASEALQAPSNALSQLLAAYMHALSRWPVPTKAVTSLLGFAIGDKIAQTLDGGPFDAFRLLRLSLYGLLIDGPLGHQFYRLLDERIRPEDPKGVQAVLIKTALDQLLWAPTMTAFFLAFLTTLEGRPDAVLGVLQAKLLPIMLANFTVWPLAHLVNFRFVPPEQRILFNNVVSVAWTTYLSYSCGGGGGGGGHAAGPPHDALSRGLPCAAQAAAAAAVVHSHQLADAARSTCAMESVLHAWGAGGLPAAPRAGTELMLYYMRLKADLLDAVCASHAAF